MQLYDSEHVLPMNGEAITAYDKGMLVAVVGEYTTDGDYTPEAPGIVRVDGFDSYPFKDFAFWFSNSEITKIPLTAAVPEAESSAEAQERIDNGYRVVFADRIYRMNEAYDLEEWNGHEGKDYDCVIPMLEGYFYMVGCVICDEDGNVHPRYRGDSVTVETIHFAASPIDPTEYEFVKHSYD